MGLEPARALSATTIHSFITDGFARIDDAFPRETAEEARAILWRDTGCDPHDRSTWTRPVVRLGQYGQAPFREAANAPLLHAAFDQLVGEGRWLPPGTLGTFPSAFPRPRIRAMRAGISTSASAPRIRTSCNGAPISSAAGAPC